MDTNKVGRNPLDDFSFDDLESEVDRECTEDVSLCNTTADNEYLSRKNSWCSHST